MEDYAAADRKPILGLWARWARSLRFRATLAVQRASRLAARAAASRLRLSPPPSGRTVSSCSQAPAAPRAQVRARSSPRRDSLPNATYGAGASAAPPRPIAHGADARATAPDTRAEQHHLVRPRLRQAIDPKRAARAITGLRTIVAPPLRLSPGTQYLSARTLHDVVPRVVAEQAQGNPALRGFFLRRDERGDATALQSPIDLRVGVARVRRHQRGVAPREFANRIHMGFDHLPLVHRRVLLLGRLESPAPARGRKPRVRVRPAHLPGTPAPAASATLLPGLLLQGVLRHHLVHVTLHQTLPTHVRPNQ